LLEYEKGFAFLTPSFQLQEILDKNTVGVAGMNACGDDKVVAFGQWSSMKQEAQRL